MGEIGSKTQTLEELQDYIDGLEFENEGLEEQINQLYWEMQQMEHSYRQLGLRDPDTYSIAELSEIKAAIEQITSLVSIR